MSELIPCPFCGADNGYVDVIPNPFSNDIYSRGHCIKCHAVGTFYVQSYLEGELRPSFEQMAQMATEKWNTRPIEDELRKRIAELEAAQARWVMVSERLPNKSGWYRVGAIDVFDEGYTDEAYFGTMLGWRSPVRDEIYCWLDGVPELPQPPEVQA